MRPRLIDSTHTRIAFVECPKLPTCVTMPDAFAAAPIARASSSVCAIGFSTNTWMPRRAASTVASAWWWLGVAMKTASSSSPIFSNISR